MTLDHHNFRKNPTFDCSWVKYIQISHEKLWNTMKNLWTTGDIPISQNKIVVTIRSHWFLVASIGGKLPSNRHVETRGIRRSAGATHGSSGGIFCSRSFSASCACCASFRLAVPDLKRWNEKERYSGKKPWNIGFFSAHKWENYRLFMGI